MPANPQIFTPQIQGIQLENPMTFARNALAMRESQASAAANQLKVARATKAANVLAANANKPVEEIANALLREGLADEAKGFIDFATSRSQAGEAARKQEVAGLALLGSEAGAFANDPASLNKASIMPWAQNAVKRGLMSPDALARFEAMPDDPQQLGASMRRLQVQALTPVQQLETTVSQQDLGGESRFLRIPRLGGPAEEVVGSREVVTRSPNRPVQNIDMRGESALITEAAKGAGERIKTKLAGAESAVGSLQLASQLRPLLDDKNFISGTFADARLAVSRALGMDVSATETYFAGIGRQVGELIKQFGAGTGLSDADREFAQKIAGGAPVTSVQGIRRIMRINDKAARNVISAYNQERAFLGKDRPELLTMYPEVRAARDVLRTGTLNGRKVVEYSDGSVEYAD